MKTSELILAAIVEIEAVLQEFPGGVEQPRAIHRLLIVENSMKVHDISAAENAGRVVTCARLLYSNGRWCEFPGEIDGLLNAIRFRHLAGMRTAANRRAHQGD